MPFSSPSIQGVWYQCDLAADVDLGHLAQGGVRALPCTFPFSPFSHCTLCPCFEVGVSATSQRVGYLKKLSRILLQRRFVSPPSFICVSNIYLYHEWVTDVYFIVWVIIQYHFIYFIVPVIPASAVGASSVAPVSFCHNRIIETGGFVVVFKHSYFQDLQDAPGSSCPFLAPV